MYIFILNNGKNTTKFQFLIFFTIIHLNRSIVHVIEHFVSEGNNFIVYIYIMVKIQPSFNFYFFYHYSIKSLYCTCY